jgi:hypothetical protein
MRKLASTAAVAAILAGASMLAGCGIKPPPLPPEPPSAVVPHATLIGPQEQSKPDEWNLFPDPTTGEVGVYHEGNYVGAVTGNEPGSEDPPLPHPTEADKNREQNQDAIP